MEMSKDLRFAMLLDCYGEFLTPHQYRLTELYYCADLSLSEIAEIVGITRQGVRDGIKRGEQILQEMEEKLQFAARLSALRENYSAIAGSLERIQAQAADVPAVRDECRRAMEMHFVRLSLKKADAGESRQRVIPPALRATSLFKGGNTIVFL